MSNMSKNIPSDLLDTWFHTNSIFSLLVLRLIMALLSALISQGTRQSLLLYSNNMIPIEIFDMFFLDSKISMFYSLHQWCIKSTRIYVMVMTTWGLNSLSWLSMVGPVFGYMANSHRKAIFCHRQEALSCVGHNYMFSSRAPTIVFIEILNL